MYKYVRIQQKDGIPLGTISQNPLSVTEVHKHTSCPDIIRASLCHALPRARLLVKGNTSTFLKRIWIRFDIVECFAVIQEM